MGDRTAMLPDDYDAYRPHAPSRIYRIFTKVSALGSANWETAHTILSIRFLCGVFFIRFRGSSFMMNRANFEGIVETKLAAIFSLFLSLKSERAKNKKKSSKQRSAVHFRVNAQLN